MGAVISQTQQSTFCTEPASDVSTDSWQQPPNAQSKQLGPIISMLAKELQAQWQTERNMQLGNRVIRPGSNHKWRAPVMLKACSNSGCPKCAKANGGRRTDVTYNTDWPCF
ncbi:hypothetical protein WJX79_005352 [Trebouxia sp. C0005]